MADAKIVAQLKRHGDQLAELARLVARLNEVCQRHTEALEQLERVARMLTTLARPAPLTEDDGVLDVPAKDRPALRALDEDAERRAAAFERRGERLAPKREDSGCE